MNGNDSIKRNYELTMTANIIRDSYWNFADTYKERRVRCHRQCGGLNVLNSDEFENKGET